MYRLTPKKVSVLLCFIVLTVILFGSSFFGDAEVTSYPELEPYETEQDKAPELAEDLVKPPSEEPGQQKEELEERLRTELNAIHTLKLATHPPDPSFKPDFAATEAVCSVKTAQVGGKTAEIRCKNKDQYKCSKVSNMDDPNCPLRFYKRERNFNCSSVQDFLKLMKERKAKLRAACKELGESRFKYDRIHERFHYDKVGDKGLTWCPLFKACSSNINAYFCPLYYPPHRCADTYYNGAQLWRFSRFWVPDSPDVPLFMVSRDPFERVLSAYRDKIENMRSTAFLDNMFYKMMAPHRLIPTEALPHKEKLVSAARNKADQKIKGHFDYDMDHDPQNPYENPMHATFSEFISSILTGNENVHWARMIDTCTPCSPYYSFDYLLTVDNFDCEFNMMLAAINSAELQDIHEKRWETNANPLRGKHNDIYEYYGTLSEPILDAFYEFHRDDCILFDYDCEKTMCEIRNWKKKKRSPLE